MGRFSYDDFSDIAAACIIQDFFACLVARKYDRLGAKALSKSHVIGKSLDVSLRRVHLSGCFHICCNPIRPEPRRHSLGCANETDSERARTDAHENALGGGPDIFHTLNPPVVLHLHIHLFRSAAQCKLTQSKEITLPEEVSACLHGEFGYVYLSIGQSLQ